MATIFVDITEDTKNIERNNDTISRTSQIYLNYTLVYDGVFYLFYFELLHKY